jgi:prepilin-type N-terminal cleavage/methylation domain-containing protein
MKNKKKRKGFTLVEVVLAIAIVGIALLGLAQLFTYSVLINSRSEKMTNATFLAQQRIEFLRNISTTELSSFVSPTDEQLDLNSDGIIDFRRVTQLQSTGFSWNVRILVFSGEQLGAPVASLIDDPLKYRVRADISTIISF